MFRIIIMTGFFSYLILALDSSCTQIEATFLGLLVSVFSNFLVSIFIIDDNNKKEIVAQTTPQTLQTFINNGTINIHNNLCCKRREQQYDTNNYDNIDYDNIDYLQGMSVIEYMEKGKEYNHDLEYKIHLLSENMDITEEEKEFLQEKYLTLPAESESTFRSTHDALPLLDEYGQITNKLTEKISSKDLEIEELNKHKDNLDAIRRAYLSNNKEETIDVSIIGRKAIGRA